MNPLGLYLHIPFCLRKCPYCDFYSLPASPDAMDTYTEALKASILDWGKRLKRPADTCYFGGGTPSLLGARRIAGILMAVREAFGLEKAEVTVEVNPATVEQKDLATLRQCGVNRLSIGLQSGVEEELGSLGRLHSVEQAIHTVAWARQAGFDNLSLDLMIATPNQTVESLTRSIEFCASLNPEHISAYLLKLEPDTDFGRHPPSGIPDEEMERELYLTACERLEQKGLLQYEISNFALPGRESRHNLKYWNGEEYLGLGPSAHSFLDGRRFYFPRDLAAFLEGIGPKEDGSGGDFEEYAMLHLRLTEGIRERHVQERFGYSIPDPMWDTARRLAKGGLIHLLPDGFTLTREGMLVSNAVIAALLD
ncbi:radical SAM family heme chaperone HemW [Solibaculum mannosilyticum]|uniref:Heme chaperone HemW n=1 Tax=Solibaculum mannosilyticum TaxID=2780922 RepID=A0A7M3W329_9FIRM|nr:radical SAM family heme chaperone HemW [Solibaculum mannosilyticum]BCI59447.1 coproporphyrinogen III oxidase [Solibaculum mannosilyticum]